MGVGQSVPSRQPRPFPQLILCVSKIRSELDIISGFEPDKIETIIFSQLIFLKFLVGLWNVLVGRAYLNPSQKEIEFLSLGIHLHFSLCQMCWLHMPAL